MHCSERETNNSGKNGRGCKGVNVREKKISIGCSKESQARGLSYNVRRKAT